MSLIAACGADHAARPVPMTDEEFVQSVLDWRAGRLERLTAPNGYLTLVGLFWLEPGVSTFGASADSDLVFPGAEHGRVGEFELRDGVVTMTVDTDADVQVDGEAVKAAVMPDDTTENTALATYGSLAWIIVKRQDMVGVRLHDYENPVLAKFPEIPHFDIDRDWSVEATLKRYDEPRVMDVGTVVEGLGWNPQSPGIVEFEVDGNTHSLEAYDSGERLFFVFGDRTSGKETYPAGRFLYAMKPVDGDTVMLDFNQSYNPPCAFNDFATCPVASPRNRLNLEITAGEKFVDALYFGAEKY